MSDLWSNSLDFDQTTESRSEIGPTSYGEFKHEVLPIITGFYPNLKAWLLKNERARTVEEFDRQARI